MGKQGAALKVEQPAYLAEQFNVPHTVPHITLLINPDYESKHLGPMVLEAQTATWEPTVNNYVWHRADKNFIKVMVSLNTLSIPQEIKLPSHYQNVEKNWR